MENLSKGAFKLLLALCFFTSVTTVQARPSLTNTPTNMKNQHQSIKGSSGGGSCTAGANEPCG